MTYKLVPLGELASLQAGYGFPVEFQGRSSGDYPFAKVGDISRCGRSVSSVLSDADHFVDAADLERLRAKPIPAGSILFAKIGEAIRQNHRVVAGCEMLIDNNAMAAIPSDKVDGRYLYHFLKTVDFYRLAPATTVPALRKSDLEKLPTPCPPLPEQRRIAAILDKADSLRTKRREALGHLDRLAQSIFLEMFGDPVTNPKGWRTLPLTEACQCYSGGTPSKSNSEYWNGHLHWFSPKDLKRDDLFESADHINAEVPNWTSLRLLPADTVVIVVRGMILAHTFPVSVLRVPATINQDLKALLPKVPLRPQFLANCLRAQSSTILERVSEAGHGTKRLDAEGLRGINILLPSISSQDEFEDRVRVLKELQASSDNSHARQNSLFLSLQHRAFRGEL